MQSSKKKKKKKKREVVRVDPGPRRAGGQEIKVEEPHRKGGGCPVI